MLRVHRPFNLDLYNLSFSPFYHLLALSASMLQGKCDLNLYLLGLQYRLVVKLLHILTQKLYSIVNSYRKHSAHILSILKLNLLAHHNTW